MSSQPTETATGKRVILTIGKVPPAVRQDEGARRKVLWEKQQRPASGRELAEQMPGLELQLYPCLAGETGSSPCLSGPLPHTWRVEMKISALALSRDVSKIKWAKGCKQFENQEVFRYYQQGHQNRWVSIPAPTLNQPHHLRQLHSSPNCSPRFHSQSLPPLPIQNTFPKI